MRKSIRSKRHALMAQAIADHRKEAGLTQADVAKLLGRHQPFIANIESGERRVDLVELLDIGEIIGLDVVGLIKRLRMTRLEN